MDRKAPPARLVLATEADTVRLGGAIAGGLAPGRAVLLEGPLGAGKTTLARAILRAATGDPALVVPSPTFTLVQSYDADGLTLHHFDLWRLAGREALAELGWEEAVRDAVLVEWPDRLGWLRPDGALTVTLAMADDGTRECTLEGAADHGETEAALRTAGYFAERRGRVDWAAFDRLMQRAGGEPPRPGDEIS